MKRKMVCPMCGNKMNEFVQENGLIIWDCAWCNEGIEEIRKGMPKTQRKLEVV